MQSISIWVIRSGCRECPSNRNRSPGSSLNWKKCSEPPAPCSERSIAPTKQERYYLHVANNEDPPTVVRGSSRLVRLRTKADRAHLWIGAQRSPAAQLS